MCLDFAQVQHHMRRLEDFLIDERNLELKARLELPFSMMISGSEYVIRSTDKLELTAEKYRFDPDRDVLDLDDGADGKGKDPFQHDPFQKVAAGEA